MPNIQLSGLPHLSIAQQPVELVEGIIQDIVQAELSDLPTFTDQLICGALPVG